MNIERYATHGRTLLVEFMCYRCKTTATRPLKDCMEEETDDYRELYDLRPPKEWQNGGFYYPLFCPKCAKAYELFMSGKGGEEEAGNEII